MPSRGPIVEKWPLKPLDRNNGIIQFQFVHHCIVDTTRSKLVNGLPRFSRITFRLNKSVRIIGCSRSFDVVVYCISQRFVLCPVA